MTNLSEARPGDLLPPRTITIAADPMKVMALLLQDSNVIHFDTRRVAELGLGDRPINQGPSNLGYVISMLQQWAGSGEYLRSVSARFQANSFAGDTVVAHGAVTSTDRSINALFVTCDVALDRTDGTRILSGTAVVGTRSGTVGPTRTVAKTGDCH